MMSATRAENIVVAGQRIKGGAMGITMTFQNTLQRFGCRALAVVGIVAKQHHMANAPLPHFFECSMQRIGAFVENPGGFACIRPATHGDAFSIDLYAGKTEIGRRVMEMGVGNDGDGRKRAFQHGWTVFLPSTISIQSEARRAAA
ncbi:hypothetical protein D3C71_1566380 [compost metagenome]